MSTDLRCVSDRVSSWSDIAAASPLLRGRHCGGVVMRHGRWARSRTGGVPSLIGGALSLTDRMYCRHLRGLSRNRRASLPCAVLLRPIQLVTDPLNTPDPESVVPVASGDTPHRASDTAPCPMKGVSCVSTWSH